MSMTFRYRCINRECDLCCEMTIQEPDRRPCLCPLYASLRAEWKLMAPTKVEPDRKKQRGRKEYLRPYTVEESRDLVGKVVKDNIRTAVVVSYLEGTGSVMVGPILVTREKLLGYTFLDGKPCGVIESED